MRYMSADRKIRVAIVGVGMWGARTHLPTFASMDDVCVVGLADSQLDTIKPLAREYGIEHAHADAGEMLRAVGSVDAVVIATPTDTHRDVALMAINAGAHVLCEKPLGYATVDAREMVTALHARERVGKVGFLFRYSPVVERMKKLVEDGVIGEVQLFESMVVNAQFIDSTKPLHWKMERSRANGGVFVEYGVHSIDLALWFGGPIASVVAHGLTLIPHRSRDGLQRQVDVDDATSWIATYRHGGEALFRAGWASLPIGGGGIRVYGSNGSLAWQLDPTTRRSEKLIVSTIDAPEPRVDFEFQPPFDPKTDTGVHPLGLLARYNARLDASFVDDVRAGRVSGASFDDGLAAQRVLGAIRKSLDEQRWVDVEAE